MKRQTKELAPVVVLRPGELEPHRPRTQAEIVNLLVEPKFGELLAARDDLVFEPFFRTRQAANEIKRLQTVPERKKWSLWFERYGCLSCHKQDQPHGSTGLCTTCHVRIYQQLKQIVSELNREPTGRSSPSGEGE